MPDRVFGGGASETGEPARPDDAGGAAAEATAGRGAAGELARERSALADQLGGHSPPDHPAGDSPAKARRRVTPKAHGSWPPSLGAAEPGGDRGGRPSAGRVLGTLRSPPAPGGRLAL